MLVRQYLDRLDDQLRDPFTRLLAIDRWELLDILSVECQYLSGEFQWDWAARYLPKIIQTYTGKRAYLLPDDFGLNFARGSDRSGKIFTITLDDGSNESPLEFEDQARLHTRDLTAESNGKPARYAIRTRSTGQRELVLSPPPDSNSSSHYTINGMYVPTDWTFDNQDTLLPVPDNSSVLEHRILARVYEGLEDDDRANRHEVKASRAQSALSVAQARSKSYQLRPKLSRFNSRNQYRLMRSSG